MIGSCVEPFTGHRRGGSRASVGPTPAITVLHVDMRRIAAMLAEQAEQQIHYQVWQLTPNDHALVLEAEAGLRKAVGPPEVQGALSHVNRLERLREVIAALALCLARTRGRLAWFLSGAINVLEPVLGWRALPAEEGGAFGTVLASPEEYAEAAKEALLE